MNQQEAAITPEMLAWISPVVERSSVGMRFGDFDISFQVHNGKVANVTYSRKDKQMIKFSEEGNEK